MMICNNNDSSSNNNYSWCGWQMTKWQTTNLLYHNNNNQVIIYAVGAKNNNTKNDAMIMTGKQHRGTQNHIHSLTLRETLAYLCSPYNFFYTLHALWHLSQIVFFFWKYLMFSVCICGYGCMYVCRWAMWVIYDGLIKTYDTFFLWWRELGIKFSLWYSNLDRC